MSKLEKSLLKFPILSVIAMVVFCIAALVFIPPLFISTDNIFDKDIAHSIIQLVLCGFILTIIHKFGWTNKTGITTKFKHWPKRWWIAPLPMALLALLNVVGLDSALLVFDINKLFSWLFVNITTGIFEELLLRGLCFYLLLNAWQHKNNALFKAAIAQAVIFGSAHLINLTIAAPLDVFAQVTYATLFGIGFAGLLTNTKSLWLPIGIHALINAASGFAIYFIPNVVVPSVDLTAYIVGIVIISIFCTVPGLYLLRNANRKMTNAQAANT
jgi:membrane protease YdiL (CAAX protease family)